MQGKVINIGMTNHFHDALEHVSQRALEAKSKHQQANHIFEKVIYDYKNTPVEVKKAIVMAEVKQIISLNPDLWLEKIEYGEFRHGAQTLLLKFKKKESKGLIIVK